MAHLAVSDRGRTVLMIQVENEIGMIPEPRDRSPLARAAWAKPVPPGLPGAGKSWAEAYGDGADEAFMANAYARYTERSEEHTSDLPSLMRTSYAVFCLNNKKK